jgi:hypothetical protein
MSSKTVMMQYAYNDFLVSEEGFETILELVKQFQVCGTCKTQIDKEQHLLVGKNLCLACLLNHQPKLTFLGPVAVDSTDGDITYGYTDEEGIVYSSKANHSTSAEKDLFASITKAGFTVPEFYVPFKGDKNNPIALGRSNWTVYGKLSDSVIILDYSDTSPTVKATFLSYREGQVIELNKRNLAFKQMFERAKTAIESTKHRKFGSDYYYDADGHEMSRITDTDLYPIIARFESAVWDVQRQFMPAVTQPELIEAQQQELSPAEEENHGQEIIGSSIEPSEQSNADPELPTGAIGNEPVHLETRRKRRGTQSEETSNGESAE